MPENLPFTKGNREFLTEADLEFFVKKDLEKQLEKGSITQKKIDGIYRNYDSEYLSLIEEYKGNKKQMRLWLETQVTLQWAGGQLPAQFRLDGFTRELTIIGSEKEIGRGWAIFQLWQKIERRRRFWQKSWEGITKVGAVLAILLTLLKALEFAKAF